jgi:hypothetical protein
MAACAHARLLEAHVSKTRTNSGPTVLRMILARQLQELREKAGLSHEQAAEAIYASPWTVRRMERAEGGLKALNVKGLPFAAGPHPAMYGTFHVFRFPAPELPDIVCGENMTSAFYPGKPRTRPPMCMPWTGSAHRPPPPPAP